MAEDKIKIRKYEKRDRGAVREISCSTAFIGEDTDVFFEGRELIADALTLYFTDYEPGSCFVAENNGEVVGYIIGAKDEMVSNTNVKLASRLFIKALTSHELLKKKNIIFLVHCLSSFLKGEFIQPEFSKDYPAILHINLKEGFRKQGIGAQLIGAYLDYLKENKVKGVHLATMSSGAADFFSKQGFKLLLSAKRSYFRYILHKDIIVYVYGKHL